MRGIRSDGFAQGLRIRSISRADTSAMRSTDEMRVGVQLESKRGSRSRKVLIYLTTVAAAVAIYGLIRHVGNGLIAPTPVVGKAVSGTASAAQGNLFVHVLLALLVIILAARLLG